MKRKIYLRDQLIQSSQTKSFTHILTVINITDDQSYKQQQWHHKTPQFNSSSYIELLMPHQLDKHVFSLSSARLFVVIKHDLSIHGEPREAGPVSQSQVDQRKPKGHLPGVAMHVQHRR